MIFGGVLIPSIGGGVCQTATTIFNAAFEAGLPVKERHNHSWYISHYPMGRDATVSWGGPDLVFKNDLDHALLIDVSYTDATFTISFYGTKQDAGSPRRRRARRTTRSAMHYAIDPTAAPGSRSPSSPAAARPRRERPPQDLRAREADPVRTTSSRATPGEPDDGVRPRQQAARSLHHPADFGISCRRHEAGSSHSPTRGLPRLEPAHRRAPRPRRRRLRRPRGAGLDQPAVHARSDHRTDVRRRPRRRLLRLLLAVASLGVYIFVGALGAPVYADHSHGWDVLTGPTGGYIIGFVLAAALTGLPRARALGPPLLLRRRRDALGQRRHLRRRAALARRQDRHGLEDTLEAGLYPFVVGDLIKLYLAGALLPAAWALVRRFKG